MSDVRHYEFTGEEKVSDHGFTVKRIRALVDIPRFGVRKGDVGGWVEGLHNLQRHFADKTK